MKAQIMIPSPENKRTHFVSPELIRTNEQKKEKVSLFLGIFLIILGGLVWKNTNFIYVAISLIVMGSLSVCYYFYQKANALVKQFIQNILFSFIWLLILLVFAYPLLIEAFFNKEINFDETYINSQCLSIVLFSNIGFLLLTIYDYWISQRNKTLGAEIIITTSISIVSLLAIFGLSNLNKSGRLSNYPVLTHIPNLVYWTHLLFLVMLFYIKYLTLASASKLDITEFR